MGIQLSRAAVSGGAAVDIGAARVSTAGVVTQLGRGVVIQLGRGVVTQLGCGVVTQLGHAAASAQSERYPSSVRVADATTGARGCR